MKSRGPRCQTHNRKVSPSQLVTVCSCAFEDRAAITRLSREVRCLSSNLALPQIVNFVKLPTSLIFLFFQCNGGVNTHFLGLSYQFTCTNACHVLSTVPWLLMVIICYNNSIISLRDEGGFRNHVPLLFSGSSRGDEWFYHLTIPGHIRVLLP